MVLPPLFLLPSALFNRSSTGDNSPRRAAFGRTADSFASFFFFFHFYFVGVVVTRLPAQYRNPVSMDWVDERIAGRGRFAVVLLFRKLRWESGRVRKRVLRRVASRRECPGLPAISFRANDEIRWQEAAVKSNFNGLLIATARFDQRAISRARIN